MVLHHIVLFKLKKEMTKEQREEFIKVCQEGLSKIPYGTSEVSGPPVFTERAGGYDYGLYRALKDVDEFQKYRACDEHMALINGPVKEGVAEMVSFQIQG
ncbi:Dabb family protein [Sporobolomyces salmoneus]|uniref:Dabb family protein n=1 Tax=Sporobolomyces salmoneus TaxID=183962 RepID=UPI003172D82B